MYELNHMWNLKKKKHIKAETNLVVARGWRDGGGNEELFVKEHKLPLRR